MRAFYDEEPNADRAASYTSYSSPYFSETWSTK